MITRRDFLAQSASLGAGLLVTQTALGQLIAATPETAAQFAPPGEFKVKYFGRFSELPIGSVTPRGWIKGWLDRQLQGLTGHPENLAYPYDTCRFAGTIPPPPVPHWRGPLVYSLKISGRRRRTRPTCRARRTCRRPDRRRR